MTAAEYLPGRLLDRYGETGPLVLLWHGRGPDERDVLAGLASAIAAYGATVLVPDWRSDAPDSGREQLLAALAYARAVSDDLVLAGWSRGAAVAAGIALRGVPDGDGWRPHAVVGLAGGYGYRNQEPVHRVSALDLLDGRVPVPFFLAHGAEDEVVPVQRSRLMAAALREHGAAVEYEELPTNHAGIVRAVYDRTSGRCRPADTGPAAAAGERSARLVARARGVLRR